MIDLKKLYDLVVDLKYYECNNNEEKAKEIEKEILIYLKENI